MTQPTDPRLYNVVGKSAEAEAQTARELTSYLQRSSLYGIVAGMEESRHRLTQARHSPIILPDRLQDDITDPIDLLQVNSFFAFARIKDDPEFKSFEDELVKKAGDGFDKGEKTARVRDGVDRYAAFLASNAAFLGKMIAVTPDFQDYMRHLTDNSGPGPFFNKTLRALTHGDQNLIGFVLLNAHNLVYLDHFHLQSEKAADVSGDNVGMLRPGETPDRNRYPGLKVHIEANLAQKAADIVTFSAFKRTSSEVIDPIYNPADTSPWKQFLTKTFPAFVHSVLINWDRKNYDPRAGLERVRGFFEAVGADHAILVGRYLTESMAIRNRDTLALLDNELRSGNLQKVRDFLEFRQTINSASERNTFYQGENEALSHWTEQVASGKIDQTEAMQIARGWTARKTAIASLPDPLKFAVCQFTGQIPGLTTDKYSVPDSLKVSTTYLDAEKSTRLIAVGLPPVPALIDAFDKDPLALAQTAVFSSSLFETADQNRFEPVGEIILRWSVKLLQGRADPAKLDRVSDAVIKLINAKKTLSAKLPNQVDQIRNYFRQLLTSEDPTDTADAVALLAENGMFPTQNSLEVIVKNGTGAIDAIAQLGQQGIHPTLHLIDYVIKEGSSGLASLVRLKERSASGQFDPSDRLARELCFPEFLAQSHETGDQAYEKFSGISILTPADHEAELHPKERYEAQIGAFENAFFMLHLEKWAEQSDREFIVIGNERNGANFIVDPLQRELDRLGVRTRFFKIPSTGTGFTSVFDAFPDGFIRELVRKEPNLVIVDRSPTSVSGDCVRLPSAMSGYKNWFTAYNTNLETTSIPDGGTRDREDIDKFVHDHAQLSLKLHGFEGRTPYRIRHWVPQPTAQIDIGGIRYPYEGFNPKTLEPQVILANPVITPGHFDQLPAYFNDHNTRFLDDPNDRALTRDSYVFTSKGLEKLFGDKTEADFVSLIQDQMMHELPGMMRLAQEIYFRRMGL